MRVIVQGFLTLKAALGRHAFELPDDPPPTLQDLLSHLQAGLGQALPALQIDLHTGKSGGRLIFLHNGQHLSHLPAGLKTLLQEGDVLSIFPPIAGGSEQVHQGRNCTCTSVVLSTISSGSLQTSCTS